MKIRIIYRSLEFRFLLLHTNDGICSSKGGAVMVLGISGPVIMKLIVYRAMAASNPRKRFGWMAYSIFRETLHSARTRHFPLSHQRTSCLCIQNIKGLWIVEYSLDDMTARNRYAEKWKNGKMEETIYPLVHRVPIGYIAKILLARQRINWTPLPLPTSHLT